jgi:hypothetical protein
MTLDGWVLVVIYLLAGPAVAVLWNIAKRRSMR